ncbi:hypothetical protein TcasGA2_TC032647 [Tribolium castaneum]|uniref:Uncharacterized protein n=1 Tax=Tribolium castaneum TaxID=7070 RepID=A0A139WKE4_TRICA|nr:hypothetical protein TcasGA2_TC032647 [Tribolium castaneum]
MGLAVPQFSCTGSHFNHHHYPAKPRSVYLVERRLRVLLSSRGGRGERMEHGTANRSVDHLCSRRFASRFALSSLVQQVNMCLNDRAR